MSSNYASTKTTAHLRGVLTKEYIQQLPHTHIHKALAEPFPPTVICTHRLKAQKARLLIEANAHASHHSSQYGLDVTDGRGGPSCFLKCLHASIYAAHLACRGADGHALPGSRGTKVHFLYRPKHTVAWKDEHITMTD